MSAKQFVRQLKKRGEPKELVLSYTADMTKREDLAAGFLAKVVGVIEAYAEVVTATGIKIDYKIDRLSFVFRLSYSESHFRQLIIKFDGTAYAIRSEIFYNEIPKLGSESRLPIQDMNNDFIERRLQREIVNFLNPKRSGVKCHICGCDDWYDSNGNGLCDGTDWFNPTSKCGHPLTSHY